MVEYGVPSAKFIVKGTLVDKTANSIGISGMKVAIGYPYADGTGIRKTYYIDSILTNNTGVFNLSIRDSPTSGKFVIKYEDTDAAQDGNYGLTTFRKHSQSMSHIPYVSERTFIHNRCIIAYNI
ncbi:MAG: radical SAM-associated putative lipoprotein, partial [Prevotella sp.]|nr:radical SAM-associated putative lipoprotein [Prevotella sp.]